MTGRPVERHQADGAQEEYSELTGLDSSNLPDLARQEWKTDADINNLMDRFLRTGALNQRPVNYGEQDYNTDLQQALQAIQEAKFTHSTLPEEVRNKYPTWQAMLNAVESGQLRKDMIWPPVTEPLQPPPTNPVIVTP